LKTTSLEPKLSKDFSFLRKGKWTGFIKSGFEELFLIFEDERKWFERAVRVFNRSPNRVFEVYFPKDDQRVPIVVKSFGWRKKVHRWVSPLMESKALHSLKVALILQKSGLYTPNPLAAIEVRRLGFVEHCIFITESLGETETLRWVLRQGEDPSYGESLLIDAGKSVRKMHDAGVFHRDLTLANFLIPIGDRRLFLIDLNRAVLRKRALKLLERVEDISKMDLHCEEFHPFLRGYFHPKKPDYRMERLVILRAKMRRKTRRIRKALSKVAFSFSRAQRSENEI